MKSPPHTHPLVESVRENLKSLGVDPASKILAGVSGGVDSMVMLHVLKTLGHHVSVAHINFNLRGDESKLDETFVRSWCNTHDITYYKLSTDTKAYSEENKLSTQEAARNIRYAWWDQLVELHSFSFVATAHHLDDAIETTLMNLFRGTGFKGLTGIPARRGPYIRPLLNCSRAEIEKYADTFSIPFRNDSSNETDHYQRNKLRHHLIPLLQELYPGWHTSFKHSLHRMQTEWQAWYEAYAQWQSEAVTREKNGYSIKADPAIPGFQLRWLEEQGIPWMLANDFISANDTRSGTILSHGYLNLYRTTNGFFLENSWSEFYLQIHQPGSYRLGDFMFEIQEVPFSEFSPSGDPKVEYVSTDSIRWPLEIKPVEPGDRFQPLGMQGKSQKLQDYFVNMKMDMHMKHRQLVLRNAEHIIWLLGLRLDERAKVKPDDRSVFRLSYTRMS